MVPRNIEQDNELFEGKRYESIVSVYFKEVPMLWLSSLENKEKLLSYFEQIECVPSTKAVILYELNGSLDQKRYFELYDWWRESGIYSDAIRRIYNAIDQVMLRIVNSSKIFISVQSGKVILPFFTSNFACDYRIVADNLVVQNPAPKVGKVPNGACAYFLTRILGPTKAEDILLSSKGINAYELLRLKLVDKVVSFNKLSSAALDIAKKFSDKSDTSLVGVKRLVNYSLKDLKDYLEYENEQLIKIFNKTKPKNKRV